MTQEDGVYLGRSRYYIQRFVYVPKILAENMKLNIDDEVEFWMRDGLVFMRKHSPKEELLKRLHLKKTETP